jgi:leucyl aminopeptidase
MPLKISVRSVLPSRETGDVIVVLTPLLGGRAKKNERTVLDGFDRALNGALTKLIKKDEFKGKKDQSISISTPSRINADRLFVIGVGAIEKLGPGDIRTFGAKAARIANSEKAKRLVLGVPAGLEDRLRELVEGLELGAYRFTRYLTGDRRPKAELGQVAICVLGNVPKDVKEKIDTAQIVAGGVNLARDLSNEPPNILYPDTLAEAAKTAAKDANLKIQVFDYKEIQKRGMKLLQAVGQGSERKPAMVHFSYVPAGPSAGRRRIAFVGKGITFDSGGLSIKPAAGMGEMKHDMSGAANIVGLMSIIGKLKPNVEVHGVLAAAENMPDGNAYRPGDVWGSLDGKSVEIINTDAEGRLILADALAYTRALEPDLLVDNATLTGACVVALGNSCSGWYANNEATADEFAGAAKASGEQMWRLPLLEDLKDQLKSDCADLRHTGDRWGGSISAALFLREFIGEVPNWVHCDIAGPAMGDRVRGWDPKGGTGHGVLTFLSIVDRASRAAAAAPAAAAPSVAKAQPPAAKAAPAESAVAVAKAGKPSKKGGKAAKAVLPAGTRGGTKKSTAEGPRTAKAGGTTGLDDGARQPQGRKPSGRKRR